METIEEITFPLDEPGRSASPKWRSGLSVLKAALPGLLLLGADQAFKAWALAELPLLKRAPILGQEYVVLARYNNLGLAGGWFSAIPRGFVEPYTIYLPLACLAVFGALAALRWPEAGARERSGSLLLLASGISNLLGNLFSGRVVDPLQVFVPWTGRYLPFNLADVGIVVGAGLVAACLVRDLRPANRAG